MAGVHRNGDSRSCGATTVVSTNTTVFANGQLVSVNGNATSHGGGALSASSAHFYCHDTLVVDNGDGAAADSLCPSAAGAHCGPSASSASTNVFVGN